MTLRKIWKNVLGGAAVTTAVVGCFAAGNAYHEAAGKPQLTLNSLAIAALGGATENPLSSLPQGAQWLNTKPLTAADLRGKVVLVNFWTYSCINSLRPLPYLRAWAERYGKQGLVVIGVHAPEFGFEHDPDRVRQATTTHAITYPVVQDNSFGIWRGFNNQAWPAFYFIDARGKVHAPKFGEGDYAESERLIQQLLAEAGADTANASISHVEGEGIEAAPDWADLRTPETYVGYRQAERFVSDGGAKKDASKFYQPVSTLTLNQWSLGGQWTIGGESAALDAASGTIRFRFHARDLHLVMGNAPDGRPIRFRVTIDGAAPGADHGVDIDPSGLGEVREDRLYQLVRQGGPVGDRTFQIEFLDPGVKAYSFTFG